MRSDKLTRMMDTYTGHNGPVTVAAVQDGVSEKLWEKLTGRELGLVMNAVNDAFHRGRSATSVGAEIVDDCLWIDGRLIPLAAIRQITATPTAPQDGFWPRATNYRLAYVEGHG